MTAFQQTPLRPGFNVLTDAWYSQTGAPYSAYPLDVAAQLADARGTTIVRNTMAFHLSRSNWGSADNNLFDCQLVRRTASADTLEFICGSVTQAGVSQANSYVPATGEPVVLAYEETPTGGVPAGWFLSDTSVSILGQTVPLRSRQVVVSSEQRAANTASAYAVERNPHDVIRVRFTGLSFQNGAQDMGRGFRVIHWNFFKQGSGASAVWRRQCAAAADTGVAFVNGGGRYFHGGNSGNPFWRDAATEFADFGNTLASELYRGYLDGLANKFANLPTANVLIGFDHEGTSEWTQLRTLLNDFVWPEMRARFPYHTLALQGPGYNNPYSAHTQWTDWVPPGNDRNWLMEFHVYPGQVQPAAGGATIGILSQAEADTVATLCRDVAVRQNAGGYIVGEACVFLTGTVDASWIPAANDTERTTRTNYIVRSNAQYGATTVIVPLRTDDANAYGGAVELAPGSQIHRVHSQYAGIYTTSGVTVQPWPLEVVLPEPPQPATRTPRLLRGRSGARLLRLSATRLMRG